MDARLTPHPDSSLPADEGVSSAGRPAHEPDCITYRRIYQTDVGPLNPSICCCARIRADREQPDTGSTL